MFLKPLQIPSNHFGAHQLYIVNQCMLAEQDQNFSAVNHVTGMFEEPSYDNRKTPEVGMYDASDTNVMATW